MAAVRMSAWAAMVLLAGAAQAQPFDVRAWYAEGQVFVVWRLPAAPASQTSTVEIYASSAAQVDTMFMERVGRLFFTEYAGRRLAELKPSARLVVPTPAGGTYTLGNNEGVFVYTPQSAGVLFFAVAESESTLVTATNSAATAFSYDPVNQPIRPHPQFTGVTAGGYGYTAYAIWAYGSDDPNAGRPDFPVIANAAKNGVPHLFVLSRPNQGQPPAGGLYSALLVLHGGGGEYEVFLPGVPARANMALELSDGVVITPDDSFYYNLEGTLERVSTAWFGYAAVFDPFTDLPRTIPDDDALVVAYTARRVLWILDWARGENSPLPVDPSRLAVMGHSAGGAGALMLSRLEPEQFCAAVAHCPGINRLNATEAADDYLRGTYEQNLATDLPAPAGGVLGVTDVFTATTQLSLTETDFCISRVYVGKRDTAASAAWNAEMRQALDDLNDSGRGVMIFWDEREHGVEKWDDESPPTPPNDVAQWVAPIKSYRASAQYSVDTYRNNQSYPGLFNTDAELNVPGRQPDPGPGDPALGAAWGTWSGYFDWDVDSLIDTPELWSCRCFVAGLEPLAVDNSPFVEIRADLSPLKTQQFNPSPGARVHWTSTDAATGSVLQQECATVGANGNVTVTGLLVPRDPERVDVTIVLCPADLDCDGDTDDSDLGVLLAGFGTDASGDLDGDSDTDDSDLGVLLAHFGKACGL